MEWTLRKAMPEDKARIDELFVEMLQSIYHGEHFDGYEDGYLDKFFCGRDDWICVAEDKDSVIAYLSIEVYREERAYIYLDDLCVTGALRGRGIGSALMEAAEAYAREIDMPVIALHVEKTNQSAFRWYERLGYGIYREEGSRYLMLKEI